MPWKAGRRFVLTGWMPCWPPPLAESPAPMEILKRILEGAIAAGASDVHLKPDAPVIFRIRGDLVPVEAPVPTAPWLAEILGQMVPAHLRERLEREHEVDFAYAPAGMGRFRAN